MRADEFVRVCLEMSMPLSSFAEEDAQQVNAQRARRTAYGE